MHFITRILQEPRLKECDVEGIDLVLGQREILKRKYMINEVMREIYRQCRLLDEKYLKGSGQRIELGAGSSLMKMYFPDVIITDIKHAEIFDRSLDAQRMDLPADSVRTFYGINCFHHFPDPQEFFQELARTLIPGGGCILVEPYFGFASKLFYPRLFTSEVFETRQEEWAGNKTRGVMTGANQALSYIVFERDRRIFESRNRNLEVVEDMVLSNGLRYLLSGGLNFRQLAPAILVPVLKALERSAKPFKKVFGLHHAIVIRKKA